MANYFNTLNLRQQLAQLLGLQQRLLGKNAQIFTRFREGDGAVIAHEQRLAEVLLKALDLA